MCSADGCSRAGTAAASQPAVPEWAVQLPESQTHSAEPAASPLALFSCDAGASPRALATTSTTSTTRFDRLLSCIDRPIGLRLACQQPAFLPAHAASPRMLCGSSSGDSRPPAHLF